MTGYGNDNILSCSCTSHGCQQVLHSIIQYKLTTCVALANGALTACQKFHAVLFLNIILKQTFSSKDLENYMFEYYNLVVVTLLHRPCLPQLHIVLWHAWIKRNAHQDTQNDLLAPPAEWQRSFSNADSSVVVVCRQLSLKWFKKWPDNFFSFFGMELP